MTLMERPVLDTVCVPYQTRRKSSLSNLPLTRDQGDEDTDAVLATNQFTTQRAKCCFRCSKLYEQNDIRITSTVDSSTIFEMGKVTPLKTSSDGSIMSSAYSTPINSPNSSFSSSTNSPSWKAHSFTRRRSSQPLTTSFQESLLTGRTSGFPSKPISFLARLVINEIDPTTESPIFTRKEYPRNDIRFDAVYYNWAGTDVVDHPQQTPYVGSIDLDKFFIEKEISKLNEETLHSAKRSFPGFILPESFMIQLLLINDQESVSECLVFKYDLKEEKLLNGQKTFLRKNIHMITDGERHFVSTLQIQVAKLKGKYLLHSNIKVIFQNRVLSAVGVSEDASTDNMRQVEIIRGGKSKLKLDNYKKCPHCSPLNVRLMSLKTPPPFDHFKKDYSITDENKAKRYSSPEQDQGPVYQVSKRLIFNKMSEMDNYQDSQVFDEEEEEEENDDEQIPYSSMSPHGSIDDQLDEITKRRMSSISSRNRRRGFIL